MKIETLCNAALIFGIAIFFGIVISITSVFAVSRPKINLFPNDVAEHLSQTGIIAASMEKSLKDVITKLEEQSKLYKETGCEGSIDPGCDKLSKQMGNTYMEMLSIMKKSLPKMKHSIRATNVGLAKNLRKELGKKTSPADIQRLLGKQNKNKVFSGRYSISRRFVKYQQMISSGKKNTMAVLAAEIYLDSKSVLSMIDIMDAEISQQITLHTLVQAYGTLTPEMIETVDNVKNVIFGEPDDDSALPNMHNGNIHGGFVSPLEME